MKKHIIYFTGCLILLNCTNSIQGRKQNKTDKVLKNVYDSSFKIGAALNEEIVSNVDSLSKKIVLRHFNAITPENVMKAESINPEPNVYNFKPADALVKFGQDNNMFIVGHTLVWHNQTPEWFFTDENAVKNSKEKQIERMRKHIETMVTRYIGKVHAWDVVNEVIDNDGSYRPTTWVNGVGNGDTLVKYAFKYANQFDSEAELYYNDFNVWRPSKRDGIVRMVKMLQDQGIRIDGIGIQGHWGLNYPKNYLIEKAIDTFATLGVKVMITELDIDVLPFSKEGQIIGEGLQHPQYSLNEFEEFLNPYQQELPEEQQIQLANRYAEIFRLLYNKRDKIDRVTLWGIPDDMSWKNNYPIKNRTNYPLLFDRNRKAKKALHAVLNVPHVNN